MKRTLKIKICGMKHPENIFSVATLKPDFMGFIFYPKSSRFIGKLDPEYVANLPASVCPVGVFVDEDQETVLTMALKYHLKAVQLHGNESPVMCHFLQDKGLQVIKALSIAKKNDIQTAKAYDTHCNYLLFDTKTPLYGGSGLQYDWHILHEYDGATPFFLSGGIGLDDILRIQSFRHPELYGIDVNSRFEIFPGLKNIDALTVFMNELNF